MTEEKFKIGEFIIDSMPHRSFTLEEKKQIDCKANKEGIYLLWDKIWNKKELNECINNLNVEF